MVGHTANVPAIITAVETVDRELGRVLEVLHQNGGVAFVTADHGNAEVNFDTKAKVKHTSHTINPVPAIMTNQDTKLRKGGTLADITPTVLEIFGLKQPKAMTGQSLLD
jgi:2,3-bisphosphoglycerate-independent phosphoglycerate mutase